jgi:hypothetical protein
MDCIRSKVASRLLQSQLPRTRPATLALVGRVSRQEDRREQNRLKLARSVSPHWPQHAGRHLSKLLHRDRLLHHWDVCLAQEGSVFGGVDREALLAVVRALQPAGKLPTIPSAPS